jgi:hypothetical protein
VFAVTRFKSPTELTKHPLADCERVTLPTSLGDVQLVLRSATMYFGSARNGHHVAVVRGDDGFHVYDDTSPVVRFYDTLNAVDEFAKSVNLLIYDVVGAPSGAELFSF